jgi:choline-sulfatase
MAGAGSSYEESLRVPLVVAWPGRIAAGVRDEASLASTVDIVPTLAAMAGVEASPGAVGRSLLPEADEEAATDERYVVCEIPPNVGRTVRTRRYKYATYAGDTVDQLFDILEDPGETRNLATAAGFSAVLEEHKALLRNWESRLNPVPGLSNDSAWWRV